MTLGLNYELAWSGNLAMDQNRGPLSGRLAGDYQDTSINFFAVNVGWKL